MKSNNWNDNAPQLGLKGFNTMTLEAVSCEFSLTGYDHYFVPLHFSNFNLTFYKH